MPTYVSAETAAKLGVTPTYGAMIVQADQPITQDMIDRLQLRGVYAYSSDPERTRLDRLQYAGLGVAGLLTAAMLRRNLPYRRDAHPWTSRAAPPC